VAAHHHNEEHRQFDQPEATMDTATKAIVAVAMFGLMILAFAMF